MSNDPKFKRRHTFTLMGDTAYIRGYDTFSEEYYGYVTKPDGTRYSQWWDKYGMCDVDFEDSISPNPELYGQIGTYFFALPRIIQDHILNLNKSDAQEACDEFIEECEEWRRQFDGNHFTRNWHIYGAILVFLAMFYMASNP